MDHYYSGVTERIGQWRQVIIGHLVLYFEVPINLDAGPLTYLIFIFQVIFINLQWELCFRVMCLAELVTLGIGVIVVTWFVVSVVANYCLSENWFSYSKS